jgi:cytochrome c oxidase subunit I+III
MSAAIKERSRKDYKAQEERLRAVWDNPAGWRYWTSVNNYQIGLWYGSAAFVFMLFAGALALLMRLQLAVPDNDFLSADLFNQAFTLHGTVMMFLFAVPIFEAVAIFLLPPMLGAREMPFPRLGAFGFWSFFLGGIFVCGSIFFNAAPSSGWFMYPPLATDKELSGIGADIWLLGLSFIEVASIAAAVELIVGIMKCRAPGMRINLMPLFAWYLLIVAGMILFAFPPLIAGDLLFEMERMFDWPFFDAARGGDPLLWQHLFWFFGHPEVYIIFLPAAGFVSMILPTMTGVPLAGYRLVVIALLATGFTALGVWVHHMFATGIPGLAVSFFSAASMAVAVPSGIQVFAWIATLASGRLRITVPSLFVLGFLFIFTLGGLTGVMVGLVPFDWQVHDTHFVVAHFHYVLIGGMVFPLFAAFYYWAPTASTRPLSERLGRWVFGLLFVGFNVAFFPMHVSGLLGMPRRVWTYPAEMGWQGLNLLSTAGAYLLAAGVLVFVADLWRNFRPFRGKQGAGDVWKAGTLEWIENSTYGVRSIPPIDSREPLWTHPQLAELADAGAYFLPGAVTGTRETLVTSPIDGRPQYVLQLPGPGWPPFLAAVATAVGFFLLTIKAVVPALALGALAIALILWWMWDADLGPAGPPVDVGGGVRVPTYATGPLSHSWWATVVLVVVAGMLFAALVFSYLYLWTVAPQFWPRVTGEPLPEPFWPLAPAAALLASSGVMAWTGRALARSQPGRRARERLGLALASVLLPGALALELAGQRATGLAPTASSYGALVYTASGLQGFLVAALVIMALFALARSFGGRLGPERRATFDNTRLLWHYTVAQGLAALALVHGMPRVLG